MQRIVITTLVSSVLGTVSALAQPMSISPYSAPPQRMQAVPPQPQYAPQQVVAQPRYANPDRSDMGGGFIEFLFGGGAAPPPPAYQPQQVQPAYQQQQMQMQPAYAPARPMFEAQPAHPAADPRFMRQVVAYDGNETPGTIVINTPERMLYFVEGNGKAVRYGIGVGRPGFTWAGVHEVTAKREWPDWRPPDDMLKRRPDLPRYMPGGEDNPLGARAMYLGSTLYRIHGSNEPWTIGTQVSSGCIRMRNEDVIDLYERVKVGTKVVVS
jgi:lipoprotein-anchoring transpeptidase ErfK/SrfK